MSTTAAPAAAGSLEVRAISHSFTRNEETTQVCEDINLDVKPGEFLSIVGPSGCGKTTLLRIVGGLIAPTAGDILSNGKTVKGPDSSRTFVFQQDSLFPWRTLAGNVGFGLEVGSRVRRGGMSRKEWKARTEEQVTEAIELVGLTKFSGHYPHELSGGMRQRANLARALALRPETLLMDEPFSALDAQTRELMQAELLRIWRQNRSTVIFITHQIDEAVYLSDRVAVMSSGPGRIREMIDIDLPRPRDLEVKRTPAFIAYTDRIWRLIGHDARRSAALPGDDAEG
jgi:ABC-type nitrate/sulfonate/bicarbonate transport system ATPase subunit